MENTTPYTEIFELFLRKARDPVFLEMHDVLAEEDLLSLLNEAVMEFQYPKVDLYDKDDNEQIFHNKLTLNEIYILANIMVWKWSEGLLRDIDGLSYDMTPEEMRTTSKANHINSLMRFEKHLEASVQRQQNEYSRRERNQPLFDQLGGDGQ